MLEEVTAMINTNPGHKLKRKKPRKDAAVVPS